MTQAQRASALQFRNDVFPAELEQIAARRAALGIAAPPAAKEPSPEQGLMGLALSGGGIRSAAVGLGVLQSLSASGTLAKVDYLSTVSGGGLIGSTVSSLLSRPGTTPRLEDFPLGHVAGELERPAVRYLRDNDRYLAPGGALDTVRLSAVVIRGIVDNFALLVPLLLLAVLGTELAFVAAYRVGMDRLRLLPMAAGALFALAAMLQPVLYRLAPRRFDWQQRNRYELFFAACLVALGALLVVTPLFIVVQNAIDLDWSGLTRFVNRHDTACLAAVAGVAAVFGLAAKASSDQETLSGKLGIYAIGMVGWVLVVGTYLALTLFAVESPRLPNRIVPSLDSGRVTAEVQQAFADKNAVVELGAPITARARGAYRWWYVTGNGRRWFVAQWRDRVNLVSLSWFWQARANWLLLGLGLAGLLYAGLFANPNVTSLHGCFRDRMSRTFSFSVADDGAIVPEDALRLSQLNRAGTAAPYHLFNTAINLQGQPNLDLGGRDADFFLLSRDYCGSPTTGYCRTHELEKYDRTVNLATAMSISGAGLAPNAGTQTVAPLVFLLTLLNLRLDYWMPNPAWVRSTNIARRTRLLASAGPRSLAREALGQLDARGAFVNLSDGGHIENLGVYELLRRRCHTIIAVDASEDPAMTFDGFVTLQRYARIDLGIEIRIDLDPLRLNEAGHSTAHGVVGEIDYGGGRTGTLIYLKSSVMGNEPESIRAYRAANPTFPQESSDNQFFTEAQFEAYRALGELMASSTGFATAASA